jgi:hypothetical protein
MAVIPNAGNRASAKLVGSGTTPAKPLSVPLPLPEPNWPFQKSQSS